MYTSYPMFLNQFARVSGPVWLTVNSRLVLQHAIEQICYKMIE